MALPTPESIELLRAKHESGFLGFWVRQYRISYLIIFALIVLGVGALLGIQKESSPNIKFGIVNITTVYPGASPVDVDTLITDKLYKEIKDIAGAKKITSKSSLGVSSLSIELQPSTDTAKFINDVRNNISRVVLPTDAKSPNVIEIKTEGNTVFAATLSSANGSISIDKLRLLGADLRDQLTGLSNIQKVEYSSVLKYDLRVIVDKEALAGLGITIREVASILSAFNRDAPIGNFAVGNKNYDFRLSGKLTSPSDILEIPLTLPKGRVVKIGDIAKIERYYPTNTIERIGTPNGGLQRSVALTVIKNESAGIFAASKQAKAAITEALKDPKFVGVEINYANDQADIIGDDYRELAMEAITTLVLVFIVMWLFIGLRDSLFAVIVLPLAFLVTFIFLKSLGLSLNFLTNFSLVLSFGIAIDTIVVIIQAASAKVRVGYEPRTAIMLALREYGIPVISGVMTTIVAFVPMMVLPGILGKFLAYIPITIFGVLAFGLILALTVNSALYLLFVKAKKSYIHDDTAVEYASDEERALLEYERIGKTEIKDNARPLRLRLIHSATVWYKKTLTKFLESTLIRRLAIAIPFAILILSFIPVIGGKSLAGHVGFDLFPASDNGFVQYGIRGANGEKVASLDAVTPKIADILAKYPEIKFYKMTTRDSKSSTDTGISVDVTLKKLTERNKLGLRSVFDVDKALLADFNAIRALGYDVSSKVQEGGPPAGKAVAIKLVADSANSLGALITTAADFEREIRSYPGVKNIENSSGKTPGQFVYRLRKDTLSELGLAPSVVIDQIVTLLNGVTVGSIADRGEDLDIVLKYSQFVQGVSPDLVSSHTFAYAGKTYRVGDLIDTSLTNAAASISREAGLVQISIGADVEEGGSKEDIQSRFIAYANSYQYPSGIRSAQGGENQENADLIVAVLTAFFIALLAIFAILTLQFNSFKQPVIVLYSVLMALPFVFVGLLLTGNKMSLPFGIGFIAFTGIAVNHGIILIDAININLRK